MFNFTCAGAVLAEQILFGVASIQEPEKFPVLVWRYAFVALSCLNVPFLRSCAVLDSSL